MAHFIKDRKQAKNPITKRYVKINTLTGGIIGHKSDNKPYKNVKIITYLKTKNECPLCGKTSPNNEVHKECSDREAYLADRS